MENQIIPHVQGNVLSLAIPLQTETVTVENGRVTKTYTDFMPNPNLPVTVLLASGLFSKKLTATMDGNVAHITDNGTLRIGKYSIEVLCRDENCNRMRFKKDAVVRVYDLTREADIPEGIEFSSETHWLTGAVFIAYGGSGGGAEETDPVFSASPAAGITQEDIDNWDSKYDKPSTGIPKTDLASDVQTSLGKADTAVQPEQGKGLFSGSYDDLSNKPTIPAAQVQSDWNASSGMGEILNKPELADVATSGSYNDLEDTPDNLSDFNNDMGFARNIYGRLTNGSFYKGTYSGGQWIYKNTAVTPETGVLYIDVADNVSYVWSGSAFVRVDEEQTETPSVTVSATGDVSQALNPNTFYSFGAVDSLDLTLVAGTGLVVYFGRFSTSANWGGTGLTVPNGVTEGANNPSVEASKTYEFNIMDNVLLLMEV